MFCIVTYSHVHCFVQTIMLKVQVIETDASYPTPGVPSQVAAIARTPVPWEMIHVNEHSLLGLLMLFLFGLNVEMPFCCSHNLIVFVCRFFVFANDIQCRIWV